MASWSSTSRASPRARWPSGAAGVAAARRGRHAAQPGLRGAHRQRQQPDFDADAWLAAARSAFLDRVRRAARSVAAAGLRAGEGLLRGPLRGELPPRLDLPARSSSPSSRWSSPLPAAGLPGLCAQSGAAPVSAGRDLGRAGHQFRALQRARRPGSSCACSTRMAARAARHAAASAPITSGTATCPTSGRASATATASRARTSPATGIASTRPSCCSTRTPSGSSARSTATARSSAIRSARTGGQLPIRTSATPRRRRRSGVVVDDAFDWGDDRQPEDRLGADASSTRSTSRASRSGIRTCRRSCAAPTRGLASAPAIDHLQRPRRHRRRAAAGAPARRRPPPGRARPTNYWGYNTIGFFAPDARYASGGEPVVEFKTMVKALHAAGIEVILDVVYNHTAEGNHLGPTLCFRGIDNATYYRLDPTTRATTWTSPATGNTLTLRHPRVLQLIMDSLRYWVTEMHVDGFRFDLASALARELHDVDQLAAFFDIIHQDPVLAPGQADRRAVGPRRGRLPGRQLPVGWAEWNGKYRDTVRALLEAATAAGSASSRYRLTGSQRPLRGTAAAGPTPASTSSPPTTASRCTTWSATTTSTTRPTARTTATATDNNLSLELRRRRARPTTRRSWRCASGRSATCWPRCCSRRACRCCSRGDEIGRTPAGQQQRLLPGQRDQLARLGPDRRRSGSSWSSPGA